MHETFINNSSLLSKYSLDMTNTVFQRFKFNLASISHQQAVVEHGDLPNTEIFQSKDVASCNILTGVGLQM
jgi:hypothetical protein